MDNNRELLYLAALLHDIGKFYQRADTGSVATSRFLSGMCKAENAFLPMRNGIYTHKHCLWTAQFIDDFKSVFKNLVGENFSDLTDNNNLYSLAACHHLKKEQLSDLGKIVKEADWLSSGMDRETDMAFKDDQDETNWDAFKKKRMIAISETVFAAQSFVRYHLPVAKISLSKAYFPQKQFDEKPGYEQLWQDFVNEFKFIQANGYQAFSETLLNLLYKYTACIPSSTVNFPDVSLYDHLKTTAAIAVCLYDYQKSNALLSAKNEQENSPARPAKNDKSSKLARPANNDCPFLLIGGDFSGIQSYLYQIVSKYAGKNLKGRSFFLRMITDAVVRYLLQELQLFQANIIFNSGGGFYLIAPNTDFVKEKLQKAITTVEEKMFASFGTALSAVIASVPLSKDNLMRKDKSHNLGASWNELFEKKDKKKACKFAGLIGKSYGDFFEPLMQGGDALRDEITGEEFLIKELSGNKELTITKDTNRQILLGEKLRETDIMIIASMELPYLLDIFSIQPANLGYYYYFLNGDRDAELLKSVDNCTVVRFNNENFNQPIKGNDNAYELQFYGGNEWNGLSFEEMVNPKSNGLSLIENPGLQSFEEEGDTTASGFARFTNPTLSEGKLKRLGVLRMDVDNLGAIFQSGILPERASLSRFAALSRSFDYFFTGYLNTIWKETAPGRSFIIYSGGDDLFIVGHWDVIIRLAKNIQDDFREFTCYNPAFSLSGGIAIVPQKFPLMKGADESAIEEKAAKNHTVSGQSKNSVSFMGFPLNWDTEFPVVEHLKDELVQLIQKEKEAKSLLGKIMTHAVYARIKAHKITQLKTFWMLTYDLSRMIDRTKIINSKALIDNCITEVCGNKPLLNGIYIETKYHPLELWAFAARWAELEIRN